MLETTSVDAETGRLLFITRSTLFIRGAGGWGGERGPSAQRISPPPRPPDHLVNYRTKVEQALLYRLSADRNPFHSDPAVARKAGFERPILQGLCTFGFTGRALLDALCAGDPARFGAMAARFSAAVMPGDELQARIWADNCGAVFQTVRGDGEIVIDSGRFTFSGSSG
jgi:acyl dehydratase